MVKQEFDLFGCRGVVDGDGRATAQKGSDIQDVKLGTVAKHEHEPLAGPEAEGGQTCRAARGLVRVLAICPSRVATVLATRAKRDVIPMRGHVYEETRRDGLSRRTVNQLHLLSS